MFKIGEMDDKSGVITALPSPKLITGGLEVKNPTQEDDILTEIKALKGYLKTQPELKAIVNN
jgi:hypothetical protein